MVGHLRGFGPRHCQTACCDDAAMSRSHQTRDLHVRTWFRYKTRPNRLMAYLAVWQGCLKFLTLWIVFLLVWMSPPHLLLRDCSCILCLVCDTFGHCCSKLFSVRQLTPAAGRSSGSLPYRAATTAPASAPTAVKPRLWQATNTTPHFPTPSTFASLLGCFCDRRLTNR